MGETVESVPRNDAQWRAGLRVTLQVYLEPPPAVSHRPLPGSRQRGKLSRCPAVSVSVSLSCFSHHAST